MTEVINIANPLIYYAETKSRLDDLAINYGLYMNGGKNLLCDIEY